MRDTAPRRSPADLGMRFYMIGSPGRDLSHKRWLHADLVVVDRTPAGEWSCSGCFRECDHIREIREFSEGIQNLVKAICEAPDGTECVESGRWTATPLHRGSEAPDASSPELICEWKWEEGRT